jgi:hypothetical protein
MGLEFLDDMVGFSSFLRIFSLGLIRLSMYWTEPSSLHRLGQAPALTCTRPEDHSRSPPLDISVERFQYGGLAGPEGALLDLLPYEFKKNSPQSAQRPQRKALLLEPAGITRLQFLVC